MSKFFTRGGTVTTFDQTVGAALRRAREERGLTLRDVELRSHGFFKPSVLGGYERGERSISLARFSRLAEIYDFPADRLLSRVIEDMQPEGRGRVVIDLTRLEHLSGSDADLVSRFVREIKAKRGDRGTEVLTLRSGDLQALALSARVRPRTLANRLRGAVAKEET